MPRNNTDLRLLDAPKRSEFAAGRFVAKSYSHNQASLIRSELMSRMHQSQSKIPTGTMLGPALFRLGSNLYRRPDLAFLSAESWPIRQRPPAAEAGPVGPDLAVEFVGPRDLVTGSLQRVVEYCAAGVRLLWISCPDRRKVYSYRSPKVVAILDQSDGLDGWRRIA